MKAYIYREYGGGDVVHAEEFEKPSPADNEVLIRIRAASVNAMDAHFMTGVYIMRPFRGLRRPRPTRPGADLAGEVEAVGASVTRFRKGDRVFGVARGSLAEYVCAAEDKIAMLPANLTFEQAAAIPVAGLTALQGLRDKGKIGPGQNVLVYGASGGVGTFAVQIAKALGARVTAVCSTDNVELARSLGADRVIDYKKEDVTRSGERYDVVYVNGGSRSFTELRRVMKPKTILIPAGGSPGGKWLGPIPQLLSIVVSGLFASQRVAFFIAKITPEDLKVIGDMIEAGKVMPVIDRQYPFAEVPAALSYLKEGHARAKVVITVA
jgi:NADPH:quinone reductase-like Zn-dependent oxidoreductase